MTMTPAFKRYCANVVIGGFYGMTIGAAAGATGGRVGLNQYCRSSTDLYASPDCHAVENEAAGSSARLGMLAGGAVGLVTGAVFYPAYRFFVSCFYQDEPNLYDRAPLNELPDEMNNNHP